MTQPPSTVYITTWFLEGGQILTAMTNKATYEAWCQDPRMVSIRRVARFNSSRKSKRPLPKAVGMTIHPYLRAA